MTGKRGGLLVEIGRRGGFLKLSAGYFRVQLSLGGGMNHEINSHIPPYRSAIVYERVPVLTFSRYSLAAQVLYFSAILIFLRYPPSGP